MFYPHVSNHYMTLTGVTKKGVTILKGQARANFSPTALQMHIFTGERSGSVLHQVRINGKPQLKDRVPDYVLTPDAGHGFMPMLEPIHLGDNVEVEIETPVEGQRVTFSLSGSFSLDDYVKRAIETGENVQNRSIGFSSDEHERDLSPHDRVMTIERGNDGLRTVVITRQPQMTFKPMWLAVDPECQPYYDIEDVRVGKDSQNITMDPIPASCFPVIPDDLTEKYRAMLEQHLPVSTPGILLTVAARERSKDCPPFRAALHGLQIGI